MPETNIFAVAGNPVLHSKSPLMFHAAFRDLSVDGVYIRLALSSAREIIDSMEEIGIRGLNVTAPFKEAVIPFLDRLDDAAGKIGAVNTVVKRDGRLTGFNTDYLGVTEAFRHSRVPLAGSRVTVLGAGGAARAAVYGTLSQGAEVTVTNRTLRKAVDMAERFGCKAVSIEKAGRAIAESDVLVSTLPAGTDMPESFPLRKGLVLLEANYAPGMLLGIRARKMGCTVIDGREWLLFQGAEAFRCFTGLDAPLAVMRKALYKAATGKKKNLALVGFMGSGKTTVGKELAKSTGMGFVDMDRNIEEKQSSTVSEIFHAKGEEAFRRMETKEILRSSCLSGRVLSCGGGAVLRQRNVEELRANSLVLWLFANAETTLGRVGGGRERPLLKELTNPAGLKLLLEGRIPLYARASDLVVRTDGKRPEEIAERILDETNNAIGD
jgi:shikimate dehydrogenase